MDQETSPHQTIQQEIQALGGRLIRLLWWYFVSNARKKSHQELREVTELVKKIIGEN